MPSAWCSKASAASSASGSPGDVQDERAGVSRRPATAAPPAASTSAPTVAATSSQARSLDRLGVGAQRRSHRDGGAQARRPEARARRSPARRSPSGACRARRRRGAARPPAAGRGGLRARVRRCTPPACSTARARSSTRVEARRFPAKVRQAPGYRATPPPWKPPPRSRQSRVRVLGDRLRVDGLVVGDECAVRLVAERAEAGEDPAAVVTDAIEIGARVLDREQTGVPGRFRQVRVRARGAVGRDELHRAGPAGGERAEGQPRGGLRPRQRPSDQGARAPLLRRQQRRGPAPRPRAPSPRSWPSRARTCCASSPRRTASNPLAGFQRAALHSIKTASDQQHAHLREMNGTIVALKAELAGLRAEKEKFEEVAAEAEKGTAKGRSYEEEVAAAIDAIALPLGDDAAGRGRPARGHGQEGRRRRGHRRLPRARRRGGSSSRPRTGG